MDENDIGAPKIQNDVGVIQFWIFLLLITHCVTVSLFNFFAIALPTSDVAMVVSFSHLQYVDIDTFYFTSGYLLEERYL